MSLEIAKQLLSNFSPRKRKFAKTLTPKMELLIKTKVMQVGADRSIAKNAKIEHSQMIHKTFIKLDSIETFMPIMKYLLIFIQSNTYSSCTINETHRILMYPFCYKLNLENYQIFFRKKLDPMKIQS